MACYRDWKPPSYNQNWESMRKPAGESKTYTYKLPRSQDKQGLQGQAMFRVQLKIQKPPVLLLWGCQGAGTYKHQNVRHMRDRHLTSIQTVIFKSFLGLLSRTGKLKRVNTNTIDSFVPTVFSTFTFQFRWQDVNGCFLADFNFCFE